MDYPDVKFYLMGSDLHDKRAQVEADCPVCGYYIVNLYGHAINLKTYICPGCNTELRVNVFIPPERDRWDLVGRNAPDYVPVEVSLYEGAQ